MKRKRLYISVILFCMSYLFGLCKLVAHSYSALESIKYNNELIIGMQCVSMSDNSITVFPNQFGNDTLAVCYMHWDENDIDMCLKVELSSLRDSARARVLVCLYEADDTIARICGWVDKKDCAVWPLNNRYDNGCPLIDVYENPTDSHQKTSIIDEEYFKTNILDYIEINKQKFVKVKIEKDNNVIVGWIKRWCSDNNLSCN